MSSPDTAMSSNPSAHRSELPSDLTRRLSLLAKRIRRLRLLRGMAWTVSVLTLGLAVAGMLDWLFVLSATSRAIALSAVLLGSAGVLALMVIRPLREQPDLDILAGVVESSHPELAERLMSTIELNASDDPDSVRGSAYMRRLLTEETVKAARGVDFPAAVTPSTARRAALWCGGALLLMAIPWLVAPDACQLVTRRLWEPYGNHASVGRLFFEVPDAERVVATGSDVEIVAVPRSRFGAADVPDEVWVVATDPDGEQVRRRMEFVPEDERLSAVLPHVMKSFDYRIECDAAHSPEFRIDVVDAPQIVAARLDIEPPAYTGLPAETQDHVTGDISVLEHSHVSVQLELNKPVAAVNWLWLDGFGNATGAAAEREAPEAVTMADGRQIAFQWTAVRGGRFAFELIDSHGLSNPEEPRRQFLVTHDAPPRLTVDSALDIDVQPDDRFPVSVSVSDDIAVGALELHVERDGDVLPPIPVDPGKLGRTRVEHEFVMDLAELAVQPGSIVSFRVRAADERPIPGPNEVWSERRSLQVVDEASPLGTRKLLAEHQQLKQQLAALREALQQNREQLESLEQDADAAAAAETPFEKDSELEKLAEQQVELARQADDFAAKLRERPLFEGLAEAATQVAREHLPQASDTVQQAARATVPEKSRPIGSAVGELEEAERKLSGIDARFDPLAELERDLLQLERLAQQAQRLAEAAEELKARRAALDDIEDELERKTEEARLGLDQLRLKQQQTELAAQLDELLQRRPEVLEAARDQYLETLTELAEESRELVQPQQNLAKAFGGQAEQIREASEPVHRELEALQGELEALQAELTELDEALSENPDDRGPVPQELARDAQAELQAGNLQAARERLQQSADELEQLARDAERRKRLGATPAEALQQLAEQQQALQEKAQQLSERAVADGQPDATTRERLAREQRQIEADLADIPVAPTAESQRRAAVRAAEQTAQELQGGDPARAAEQAEQTRQAITELAQRDASTPESSTEQTAMESSDGSKASPRTPSPTASGPEQIGQRAQQLAAQLGELRRQTEAIAGGPAESAREQMASVAQQQEELNAQAAESLPANEFSEPRARALDHMRAAADAARDGDAEQTAQTQQQAEQALRQLAEHAQAVADGRQPAEPGANETRQSERARELAQRQRQLQSELAEQQPAAPPSAEPGAEHSAATADSSGSASPGRESPEEVASGTDGTSDSGPAPAQTNALAQQQRQLAEQAAAQALQTAREFGPESASAVNSRETAEQAAAAARAAEFGQLDQAQPAAEAAANAAREASRQIASEPGAAEELVPQAETLAQQQAEVAEQMRQAAASPEQRSAAQQSGQQQLAGAAERLAEQFAETAQRLAQSPIDLPAEGQRAQSAQAAAERARASMQQALESLSRGDFGAGEQAAQAASEQLTEAAESAEQAAAGQAPSNSPVPGEVGQLVADAARRLQQAGQQLSDASAAPGNSGANPSASANSDSAQAEGGEDANSAQASNSEAGQSGEAQPGAGEPTPSGDTANADSSSAQAGDDSAGESGAPSGSGNTGNPDLQQTLQQVAQALANAAQQCQSASGGLGGGQRSSRTLGDGTPKEGDDVSVDLSELRSQLERLSSRDWGKLPGHLQTEILDAARSGNNSDYARLIKSYFEDIADVNPEQP